MDKKAIALLLAASCLASPTFAGGLVSKLINHSNPAYASKAKMSKVSKPTRDSYIDFSGTWIPDCGDGPMAPTLIENNEESISIDGTEYRIGLGLQGAYWSNESNSEYEHTSFEWNADGSGLHMSSVFVYKENYSNAPLSTGVSNFSFAMKNGQIIINGKYNGFYDDAQMSEPGTMHCVFTRSK